MMRYPEFMVLPEVESRSHRFLSWMAVLAVGSYFIFYVLTSWAYEFGPALLLTLTFLCLGFQWAQVRARLDRETVWFLGALGLYFVSQILILMIHGEDVSEFDLSFRYLAGGLVLLFLLVNPISAFQIFLFAGIGGVLTGGYAIYLSVFEGVPRLQSYDNPIHYGNGALALSCLCLAGLLWGLRAKRGLTWTVLMGVGIAGGVLGSLFSETRSGWVAIPVLVVLLFLVYRDRLPSSRHWLIWCILAVVALPACFAQVDTVEKRMQTAGEEFSLYFEEGRNNTSVGLRLDMYKTGLTAFSKNPLIGVGPSGTEATTDELIKAGKIHPQVDGFRHLHNQYIDNMARYGVFGLIGYLILLLVPFALFLVKTRSDIASVRALGMAGVLFVGLHGVVNLTQSMLERNIGVMMFVFVLVFLWAALKREERLAQSAADPVASTD